MHIIKFEVFIKNDSDADRALSGSLEFQFRNAIEWCDVINSCFWRKSGIKDELGRKIYKNLFISRFIS
jgi:alpha-glucuronidase